MAITTKTLADRLSLHTGRDQTLPDGAADARETSARPSLSSERFGGSEGAPPRDFLHEEATRPGLDRIAYWPATSRPAVAVPAGCVFLPGYGEHVLGSHLDAGGASKADQHGAMCPGCEYDRTHVEGSVYLFGKLAPEPRP